MLGNTGLYFDSNWRISYLIPSPPVGYNLVLYTGKQPLKFILVRFDKISSSSNNCWIIILVLVIVISKSYLKKGKYCDKKRKTKFSIKSVSTKMSSYFSSWKKFSTYIVIRFVLALRQTHSWNEKIISKK